MHQLWLVNVLVSTAIATLYLTHAPEPRSFQMGVFLYVGALSCGATLSLPAGILIALKQVKNMIGVDFPEGLDPANSFEVAVETARRLGETNYYALTIGGVAAAVMVLAPRIDRRLPGALIAVLAGGMICAALDWQSSVQIVRDMEGGGISGSLDIFHVPELILNDGERAWLLACWYAVGHAKAGVS